MQSSPSSVGTQNIMRELGGTDYVFPLTQWVLVKTVFHLCFLDCVFIHYEPLFWVGQPCSSCVSPNSRYEYRFFFFGHNSAFQVFQILLKPLSLLRGCTTNKSHEIKRDTSLFVRIQFLALNLWALLEFNQSYNTLLYYLYLFLPILFAKQTPSCRSNASPKSTKTRTTPRHTFHSTPSCRPPGATWPPLRHAPTAWPS